MRELYLKAYGIGDSCDLICWKTSCLFDLSESNAF